MPEIEQSTSDPQLPPDPPRWRERVREALRSLGGEAALQAIYRAIEEQHPDVQERKHWKAKVRQVLQADPQIERVSDSDSKWRLCPLCKDSYKLKDE